MWIVKYTCKNQRKISIHIQNACNSGGKYCKYDHDNNRIKKYYVILKSMNNVCKKKAHFKKKSQFR